jgi:hypothetical protein
MIARSAIDEFSIFVGGPVYDFLLRAGLVRLGLPNIMRRVAAAIVLTWLPLLVVSLKDDLAFGDRVRIPILYDFAMYGRLLLALPLLMLAEAVIDPAIRRAVGEFVNARVVQDAELPDFERVLHRARRLRDSPIPELALLALAFFPTFMVFHREWGSGTVSSWHTTPQGLTAAGWWYVAISAPILHFILYRWAYRYFVWMLLLWRLGRLDLHLMPAHPDRAAGLFFLSIVQNRFGILFCALGCAFGGRVMNAVVYEGTPLDAFKVLMAAFVALSVGLGLCPLALLAPTLARVRRGGLRDYGRLSTEYTEAFDRKWVHPTTAAVAGSRATESAPAAEPLLGTSDIQSLADLGNSYAVVQQMSIAPITKRLAVQLAVQAALPLIPVIIVATGTGEIVNLLVKMVV